MTVSAWRRNVTAWSLATERDRPLGGGPQGDPGLAGERVRLGTLGRVRVGREVVPGEAAGDLVGLEALEEPGRGQVADLAILLRQGVVGDLADQGLDEGVLAMLGRARIGLAGEQLAPDERPQARLELGLRNPGNGREAGEGEALAEDGGVRHERPVLGRRGRRAGTRSGR